MNILKIFFFQIFVIILYYFDGIRLKKGQSSSKLPDRSQTLEYPQLKVDGRGKALITKGKRKSKKVCALRAIYDNQIY